MNFILAGSGQGPLSVSDKRDNKTLVLVGGEIFD
jgi:hypothetical protein